MCCILIISAHIIFVTTPDQPECDKCWITIVPIIIFGICLSNFYVLTNGAIVAYLVPEENLGIAYGINYVCQNTSITLVPILVGKIHNLTEEY